MDSRMESKPLRKLFFLLDFSAHLLREPLPDLREPHNVRNIRCEKQADNCGRKDWFLPSRSQGNFEDESQQQHICAPNDCGNFISDHIRMERAFLRSLVHLRCPILAWLLVVPVVFFEIRESGVIVSVPCHLVKFRHSKQVRLRRCQPLEPNGQTFGPLPSPGTILTSDDEIPIP
jgi:hypothetical protein